MRVLEINTATDLSVHQEREDYFQVMFKLPAGQMGVNGCPMGRGATVKEATLDLRRRTEMETKDVTINFIWA